MKFPRLVLTAVLLAGLAPSALAANKDMERLYVQISALQGQIADMQRASEESLKEIRRLNEVLAEADARQTGRVEDGAIALLGPAMLFGRRLIADAKPGGYADCRQADAQPHRRRIEGFAPMADIIAGASEKDRSSAGSQNEPPVVPARYEQHDDCIQNGDRALQRCEDIERKDGERQQQRSGAIKASGQPPAIGISVHHRLPQASGSPSPERRQAGRAGT